ncbi:Prp18-domain-containing protein [Testicularia cyperi]|uniref:Pre-mRNA-splicing factor 18 n=1 Tax=Testicularia cyperi TaxID=1882483 RepID=A0A317XY11_9BASI|nr:Prp18-domain-containing protein [Testicularia cyperi]
MDFLKAEIANKRKALSPSSEPSASPDPPAKYRRRGDIEREEEEERRRKDEERRRQKAAAATGAASSSSSSSSSSSAAATRLHKSSSAHNRSASGSRPESPNPGSASTLAADKEKFNVSNEEAVRRLRAKGEPIRLFGESDKERRLRLRALELIEEKGGSGLGQNDFRSALQSAESATALEILEKRNAASKGQAELEKLQKAKDDAVNQAAAAAASTSATESSGQDGDGATTEAEKKISREGVGMESVLDLELIKTDIDRVYPIIYYTLKGLLSDWADSLAARPDDVKHTTQGKLAAATQVQSGEYLKPLFKKLRKRSLTPDVLMRLAEIVHFMQKRQYRRANDSYLQLSIGNAPWPIGVTMVGIHERSGREKIFSSNVAHVLNDEVSRKYIQSLKRLMTFAQTRYPPEDISMLMG